MREKKKEKEKREKEMVSEGTKKRKGNSAFPIEKYISLLLALIMVMGACACGKKKKGNSDLEEAAQNVTKAILSFDTKDMQKNGDFSEETIARVTGLSLKESIKVLTGKAFVEVDSDSIKESKKNISIKVNVSLPDYEAALKEGPEDEEDFIAAMKKQKEKSYKKVSLTLKFSEEDGEYFLTNGDDVVAKLFPDEDFRIIWAFLSGEPIDLPTDDSDPTGSTAPSRAPSNSPYQEIYSDNLLVLRYIGLETDGVRFELQNDTALTLVLDPECLSLNGMNYNQLKAGEKIDPHSTGEILVTGGFDPSTVVGFISGVFMVRASQNYSFDNYRIEFVEVSVDSGVNVVKPMLDGVVLYEDPSVRIAFSRLEPDGVVVNVENLESDFVQINCQSISINGVNLKEVKSGSQGSIAALSIGEVLIKAEVDSSISVGTVSAMMEFGKQDKKSGKVISPMHTFDTVVVDSSVSVEVVPDGNLIYKEDQMRLYYKGTTAEGMLFQVENMTPYQMNFYPDSLSVNGLMLEKKFCMTKIAPNSLGELLYNGSDIPASIGTIAGYFRGNLQDATNVDQVHFSLGTTVIDDSVTIEPPQPTGVLLCETDEVRIYYKGITDRGIAFEVENLTDKSLIIQSRELVVDGNKFEGTDVVMSDDISAHSFGVAEARIEDLGVTSISVISGKLRVVDAMDYVGHDAIFPDTQVG